MTQFCWDRATKLAASVTLRRRPGAMVLYPNGAAYEVEFVTLGGPTAAVVTIAAGHVRSVTKTEIPHARELALP